MDRTYAIKKHNGEYNGHDVVLAVTMWLQSISNGDYILTLKRVSQPRTTPQNRLMWLWFKIIAYAWSEAYGRTFTPTDVHDAYCLLFLPKETPKGRVAGSTSSLTTEQMTEFLNKVQADAQTEYGIELPNPEDKHFEDMVAMYN